MTNCPRCGARMSAEMSFCPNCGLPVNCALPPTQPKRKGVGIATITVVVVGIVLIIVAALALNVLFVTPTPDYYPADGIFRSDPNDMIVTSSDIDDAIQITPVIGNDTPGFHDQVYVTGWASSHVRKEVQSGNHDIEFVIYLFNSSQRAEAEFLARENQDSIGNVTAELWIKNGSYMTTRFNATNWVYEATMYRGNMLLTVSLTTIFNDNTSIVSTTVMKNLINVQLDKLAEMKA